MISVVIHSYKYGHLVCHCIESVLSQSLSPNEIFVIDDGVGDCAIVKSKYPSIKLIERKSNYGQVKGFNSALDLVNNERFMMLGADNWLRPDAIEKLSMRDADIVSYDLRVVGSDQFKWVPKNKKLKLDNHGYYYWPRRASHHGSMLLNTKLAKECRYGSYISEDNKVCEDYYIYLKMLEKGASYSHIGEGLLYYRKHKSNFNGY
tara:strand:- start:2951 stop:3565 length:615 start_codon:yes stop_codon:yes gene_type:complete